MAKEPTMRGLEVTYSLLKTGGFLRVRKGRVDLKGLIPLI